jgi:NADH-quinone oxidoreductase subunit C
MTGGIHEEVESRLRDRFDESIIEVSRFRGELTFNIKRESLIDVLVFLREDSALKYTFLTDLTATDWPARDERHEVVYLLYSFESHSYVRVKVRLKEGTRVPTASELWDVAGWFEREVYDLFGVEFEGHPDMTRILTPEGFEGHPLRKDYPLTYELPQFSHNENEPPEVLK